MKKYCLIFELFFACHCAFSQNYSSAAVSDSIHAQLDMLGYDSLSNYLETFYTSGGDLYTYLGQIPGGQFKAISHTEGPNVFRFGDETLDRAWHEFEITNWLSGETGTNYTGYACDGILIKTCTITISGDTWDGSATSDVDALARAFLKFLEDPDFATYLQ